MRAHPRAFLDQIVPYKPGDPSADEHGSLASNESPLGASPTVLAAVWEAAASLHRYPDPLATRLRDALARTHGVGPEQILLGNGSDELIFLLAWAFAGPGGRVVCADPPYRVNEISSLVAGSHVELVPLANWRHDLENMARVDANIAYIVNPHNPTGTTRNLSAIQTFIQTCRAEIAVIDEAYIDFVDEPANSTAIKLAATGKALVLRTFSKLHGLAGERLGYLVGDARVIEVLQKIRPPFSVSVLAQAAGLAAIQDRKHQRQVRQHVLRYRRKLSELLCGAELPPIPSQANFVLVPTVEEETLTARFASANVAVRPGTALGLPGAIRISVPSPEGLRRIGKVLRC